MLLVLLMWCVKQSGAGMWVGCLIVETKRVLCLYKHSFIYICDMIFVYNVQEIHSVDLQNELCHVLHGYKQVMWIFKIFRGNWRWRWSVWLIDKIFLQMLGNSWEQYVTAMDPVLQEKLSVKYGVWWIHWVSSQHVPLMLLFSCKANSSSLLYPLREMNVW